MYRANTVYSKEILNTLNSLRIIYYLQFEESDFWFDIYSLITLLLFNKNNTWRPLLKHWGYDNFELNWFHGLSKSPAIPFSQVSADSFRFNIQECSGSLYAFIAFRPTCFPQRLVMRNLHETSTQRAR